MKSAAFLNVDEALALIGNGSVIVTAMAASEPQCFFENFHKRIQKLRQVKLFCANPSRSYPCFVDDGIEGNLEIMTMFLTSKVSRLHGHGFLHYIPQHLSSWSKKILQNHAVDIFWGSCSEPDDQGEVSLGLSCVYELEILKKAKVVVLEVNPNMPRTFGETSIPLANVDYLIKAKHDLPTVLCPPPAKEDYKIAGFVSDLVMDGSTLQLGIGSIPNAVGECLSDKKNLGVHTEMINDAIMKLYKRGVITNCLKTLWKNKTVGSFVYGTQTLYEFVNKNDSVELQPASVVNNPTVIAQNAKMISINTAVEIDITGQVCSESLGHMELSGVGGAFETHYGAQLAAGGKGIIAMRSLANDGFTPKIVFELKPGAKVSISRNDVDTVITEYGVAFLSGRSVAERVKALIAIAHPKTRDELMYFANREKYI